MEPTTGLVFNVALAAGAMMLVGVSGYFALRLGDHARYQTQAGVGTLAALKWREFANLLIALFRARGFEPADKEPRSPGSGGYDLMFTRGKARYLLQCKHGSSYRVDVADVSDFLMVMRTQGAEGGFIVAMGQVDPAAQEAVYAKNLDLYDGRELWRELLRFLPRDLLDQAQALAARTRSGLIRRVAVLALLTGILAFIGATLLAPGDPAPTPMASPAPAIQDLAPRLSPAPQGTGTAPVAAPTATAPPAAARAPVLTQAQQSERRGAVVAGVRAVPGVVTADWSTNSTLLVTMQGGEEERRLAIVAGICRELEGYEELRWTRLQMHQFSASEQGGVPVRWHQCR